MCRACGGPPTPPLRWHSTTFDTTGTINTIVTIHSHYDHKLFLERISPSAMSTLLPGFDVEFRCTSILLMV
jgi:hypothetical protein